MTFHTGEYKSLPVADKLWQHVSMYFILAVPRTKKERDVIIVVVEFSKMAHFIAGNIVDDAKYVAKLYFLEIVKLHRIPKSIVSNRDSRFLSSFRGTLWRLFDTKLLFNTSNHPLKHRKAEVTNKTLGNI